MMPRGATWPSQRIINGLHFQGNFRGGIEIVVGEAGRGRGREGRQGGVSRLPLSPCCAFASESSRFEERALFLSPCLACIGSGDWRSLPLQWQAGNYFTQVRFAAYLSPFRASVWLICIWLVQIPKSDLAPRTAHKCRRCSHCYRLWPYFFLQQRWG